MMKMIYQFDILLLSCILSTVMAQFDTSTCGIDKGCIMQPAGCEPMANCFKAFSYRMDGDYLNMELVGQENSHDAWVAVGFSTDRKMGGDTVTECSNFRDSPLQGRLSYNPAHQNAMVELSDKELSTILQTRSAMFSNGRIYCSLRQKIVPSNFLHTVQVQSLARHFYILLATGSTSKNAKIMHSLEPSHVSAFPYISPEKIDLTKFGGGGNISSMLFSSKEIHQHHQHQQESHSLFKESPPRRQKRYQPFVPAASVNLTPINVKQEQSPGPQISAPILTNTNGLNVTSKQGFPNPNGGLNPNFQPNYQANAAYTQGISLPEYKSRLLKAHAICMLFSFLTFLATGILFARYFRGHCPNSKLCGLLLWFHFHRTLNLIGIAGTIAGFVCIMINQDWQWIGPRAAYTPEDVQHNEKWSSKHAMIGLLAVVIAWAQPLNATFRCHPESKLRIIFNLYHWFFGIAAWTLGATAIVIAIVHFNDMFTYQSALGPITYQRAALGLIIAYLVTLGVVLIVNELLLIYQWTQRRNNVAAADIEMIQVDGKTRITLSPQSTRINTFRILILMFFLIVAIGVPVAISVFIGLVPGPDSQTQF